MARLLASVVGLFGLGTLLVAGCSGSSFSGNEQGNAGNLGAGGTESTAGNNGQAGSANAGAHTGGSNAAGSGGAETGGGSAGRASAGNGGLTNGGATLGGAGGTSNGGSGGAGSGVCKQDSDCLQCVYNKAPQTADDCYCTNCSWKPLTKSECETNHAAFEKVCSKTPIPCPAIICAAPLEARCDKGMCVSGGGP